MIESTQISNTVVNLNSDSFIFFRNPNGDSATVWPQYTSADRKCLVLDIHDHVNTSIYSDRMTFWNRDLPNRSNKAKGTHPINDARPVCGVQSVIAFTVVFSLYFLLCK